MVIQMFKSTYKRYVELIKLTVQKLFNKIHICHTKLNILTVDLKTLPIKTVFKTGFKENFATLQL